MNVLLYLILSLFHCILVHVHAHVGLSRARKSTRPGSSTSGVGVSGRRGKRKRPPVEEDDDGDDDAFMEDGESGERAVMVEGRERYVNGLLKQLIKVHAHVY